MTVAGRIVSRRDLSSRRRDEMFRLMTRHYESIRRDEFEADLGEKEWVLEVVETETDTLCGFSTQMLLETEVGGGTVRALYSGDTIVDPAYWHRNPLAALWGRLALDLIDRFDGETLHWFLISKGYKTYRFLPVFFHEFYPRYDCPTPQDAAMLIDAFAHRKFGIAYDATRRVVPASADGCRLRPGIAALTPERMHDPHVAFFAARNPGHAAGDELCCLAPLTRRNFTTAAWKVIGEAASPVETPVSVLAR